MTIFGITGDLSRRLLFPALYNLARQHALSNSFAVIGFATTEASEQEIRDAIAADLEKAIGPGADGATVNWLVSRVQYISAHFADDAGWKRLHEVLSGVESDYHTAGNCLFYLATAPDFFLSLTRRLAIEGLMDGTGGRWRRVIIEKPFGHDLDSARELNRGLLSVVRDDQIYRIDHYLGKETVQNIMVFRFANGIFEPIWNRRYIDHVQITVAESAGVERRGRYYDHTGSLRDMVPNHMVQLLALTAMEPPSSFSSHALQNEQVKMLEAVQPIDPEHCPECMVRGQYAGYRGEQYVDPHSTTETFVALKFSVDNWRWAGVPFYLRTGKRMAEGARIISIAFREPPRSMFPPHSGIGDHGPDHLTFDLADQAKMSLSFYGKKPGPGMQLQKLSMQFAMRDTTWAGAVLEAYERLIYDAARGDRTLYTTAEGIERLWEISQPLLDNPPVVRPYHAGSWGPNQIHQLVAPFAWRLPFERQWRDPNEVGG
jgi:glucose-6-phosphate 1-dehydrogenase